MFALHERRLVPGRDSCKDLPRRPHGIEPEGLQSHGSQWCGTEFTSIPRRASPRARGCHVGWSVVHHSSPTCAAERARRRGSAPNLLQHDPFRHRSRAVRRRPSTNQPPIGPFQFPWQSAMARGHRLSRVLGQEGAASRHVVPVRTSTGRANRPCPNNGAPPKIRVFSRVCARGSLDQGAGVVSPCHLKGSRQEAPGLGVECSMWREASRNGEGTDQRQRRRDGKPMEVTQQCFQRLHDSIEPMNRFQEWESLCSWASDNISRPRSNSTCGGVCGATKPSRRQTCCPATSGK